LTLFDSDRRNVSESHNDKPQLAIWSGMETWTNKFRFGKWEVYDIFIEALGFHYSNCFTP